jgi:hypothetical protein
MNRTPSWLTIIIFAALVTAPYLVAVVNGGDDNVFAGF